MNSIALTLVQRSLGFNLVRTIFAYLDKAAFFVFTKACQVVFDLTSVDILYDSTFDDFANRIYVLVGIFMLFKVTVSLLQYLVSPEKITDKTEGLSKIITRILVSVCMLAGLPFVWNVFFGKDFINGKSMTTVMLEAVPRIIIGKNTQKNTIQSQAEDFAKSIAWTTYSVVFNQNGQEVNDCSAEGCDLDWVTDHVNDPVEGQNDMYKYDYTPGLGILLGVVMSIVMIGIAIDIAIRAFKLIILRLMAPVPIISYVLPKSSKSGGVFNNWVKTFLSTWADLFIKIGIVYFVLFMIDQIVLVNGVSMSSAGGDSIIVKIFIIIGLLFFAKQAPKFITDILGLKSTGGLGVGLGGMLAASGALLGGAGLAGAASAGLSAMNENAEAAAQGKAGTFGFGKGRDLAAQLKTGNKDAKAGLVNGLTNAARKSAIQNAAGRRAAKMGLSSASLHEQNAKIKELKEEALKSEWDMKRATSKEEWEAAFNNYQTTQANLGKAEKNYSSAKQQFDSMGLGTTWEQEHSPGIRGTIGAAYKAVSHPIDSVKRGASNVVGGVADAFMAPKKDENGKYTDKFNGRVGNNQAEFYSDANPYAFKPGSSHSADSDVTPKLAEIVLGNDNSSGSGGPAGPMGPMG